MSNEKRTFAGYLALGVACWALLIAMIAAVLADRPRAATASNAPAAVPVTLKEFSISPAVINVKAGPATLSVTNAGSAVHNLKLRKPAKTSGAIPAGSTAALELGTLTDGMYELYCDIPGHEASGMKAMVHVGATAAAAAPADEMTNEEMDAAMEAVAAKFPAATAGKGAEVMQPRIGTDGAKEFDLTASIVDWEVAPGKIVKAYTYNGVVPGPTIKVAVGDKVRLNLKNNLPESTSIHLHGIRVPNKMDGVDPYTQPSVKPGQSFVYEFTASEVAVGIYHSHHNAQVQVPNGLFAAFIVGDLPVPPSLGVTKITKEVVMVLNDSGNIGLSLNGKSFPATQPYTLKVGETMLVHYLNEGLMSHPMHLHQPMGYIIAKDGVPLKEPMPSDTINIAPGERYSVVYTARDPGVWAWHCHILNHAEGSTGMFGMVTALIVE